MGEVGEFGVVVVESGVAVVGKARHQQGGGQVLTVAHLNWLVIAPGPQARGGPEVLVQRGHGQGPEQGPALPGQADRGGKKGKAVGEVGGAIEGVNAPGQVRLALLPATFFG